MHDPIKNIKGAMDAEARAKTNGKARAEYVSRKSPGSKRIRKEILELHARGKDVSVIAIRTGLPQSKIIEIIESE